MTAAAHTIMLAGMDERLEFFVPGVPKTAGSKVSGVAHRKLPDGSFEPVRGPDGRLKTFTKDDSGEPGKAWRADIRSAAREALHGALPLDGAIAVTITFVMPRNKGHFGSGRNAGVVKPSAPHFHMVRPDIDKLSRAVLDALTTVVWEDDGQIVQKRVLKRYAAAHEPPGALICVEPPADESDFEMALDAERQLQLTRR